MKTCQRKQSWSLQSWELFQSYLTSLEDFPCELVVPEGYDIVTATVEDLLSFVSGSHAGISQRNWAAVSARAFCEGTFPSSTWPNEYFLCPP